MSAFVRKVVFPEFPTIPQVPVIVNNLDTNESNKTLAASQGVVIKNALIALNGLINQINNKLYYSLFNKSVITGYYNGGKANDNVQFGVMFVGNPDIVCTPVYNVDVNDGQSASIQVKNYNNVGFNFSSGVESGSNDVSNPTALEFFWVAIGVLA